MSKNPTIAPTPIRADLEGKTSPGGMLYYVSPKGETGMDLLDYDPDTDDGSYYPTGRRLLNGRQKTSSSRTD